MAELWSQIASALASLIAVYIYSMFKDYFPNHVRGYAERYGTKLASFVYPYKQITFDEYGDERFRQSEAYADIRSYLSGSPSSTQAKRFKAHDIKDSRTLLLTMDDKEGITEEFQGIKLWWTSRMHQTRSTSYWGHPETEERRFYQLTFHQCHWDIITKSYLNHVIQEGKALAIRNRQLKLYTNGSGETWQNNRRTKWSHVIFEHPATFKTLAIDPKLKEDIINDLDKFRNGKDFYAKVGKAWKRGYLLYGPPGTGKSSMIAAMAKYLEYDIYDLELTAVKENADLRKLLIDISNKSIIVIEDIDCSLDLTGQRNKEKQRDEEDEDKKNQPIRKKAEEEEGKKSKVTLSGLLNCIDGIWSACGGERLVVFTTNYVDKLDPALIRRGRMDKPIEFSYCSFEAFKVLAKNYLDIESHHLFAKIKSLLEEIDMTPADVAENLMPTADAETCLNDLIEALEIAKEDAKKKAEEEEAKLKVVEEEKKMNEKKEDMEVNEKVDVKCNGTIGKEVEENASIST
ncbi:AAA-ATPase ASD, mitochondrial [Ziziphus jujuba]|uniref:AAA-ATPase ASD, mitochondrial n=2 Tax=Ziziphus jujuba TaxID=326968 RepID=A0A6P3ZL80_ZIZJJ|nr:AAA-ATPase ASD, mitochondrial [Ziziphus jujuba]KAH7532588.1 hypothetical protein FEM48_Zijuj04G0037300 [Ziziphus jujuba var. spinosa]